MNIEKIKEKVLISIKISEKIQNIFKKHDVNTSFCTEGVNPYYNQVDENSEGFICEYYYSTPNKIYTPLGYISIWCGGMTVDSKTNAAIKEIHDTFGFVLKEKARNECIGVIGGWYHITKLPWNNADLKCDCIERERKDYIGYDEAMKLFKQIECEKF